MIRKGKASKPTEFGKMVKIQDQEAENQIITTTKCSISGRLTRSGWCQQGPSNSHVEPLHEESRTTAAPEQALLPQRPEVANRSCRYRGDAGLQRWVGLGVIADNLIHIGRFLAGAQRIEIERRAPKEKRKKMKKKCQSGRNPGLGSGLRSSAVPMCR